ncbi:MAG: hypothetical protein L3J59_12045 [Methylococcaceae bacterium]|nr:hypothetical protein [Methylococcaceae bacterium]
MKVRTPFEAVQYSYKVNPELLEYHLTVSGWPFKIMVQQDQTRNIRSWMLISINHFYRQAVAINKKQLAINSAP